MSEMRKNISEFEVMFGMHQAFGGIDSTHIPILRPIDNLQDYFCYKMFFSLNVQAICDPEDSLWMSTVVGLDPYMTLKSLQTPKWDTACHLPVTSSRTHKSRKLPYWRPCLSAHTTLHEGI